MNFGDNTLLPMLEECAPVLPCVWLAGHTMVHISPFCIDIVMCLDALRYTCILPNMVTITTLFQLTLEVNQASAGVSRATLPDMPATAIVNVTSIVSLKWKSRKSLICMCQEV